MAPAVIVLAGGQSRRMGTDKALVDFHGEPLVRRIAARLAPVSGRLLAVAPAARFRPLAEALQGIPGVELVADVHEGQGPLSGLHAGLAAAGRGYHFVVSCDQPFVEAAFARFLVERAAASKADAAVPGWAGRLEVLHAAYAGPVAARAEQLLLSGRGASLRALLEGLQVVTVAEADIRAFGDPERLFFNVNTPQALEQARRMG
ncbi:molybdenum cofactor guanylyltransferase [Carboxydochorda subterranea]|uniref:Probable molybdenum cofactor guanylyltransferase n=1 Tax=Carboxydichorda subterranea TaxID=3109565 RepID=A0ABZ1BTN3_9FIRM|nr:molybdenum cofactor guanylyltransferase [Limnochorda sp. L945t]WRP16151.1 molybdenum cofactor guanylyltransferase [Limnochorda sp. L945t]